MAYDNSNSGIITRNERKVKDTHPEYSGSCEIDGVEYWISAWINTGKPGGKLEGKKFFSLKFNPKDVNRGTAKSSPRESANGFGEEFDDIPF
jgi:hypothetical protein